MFILKRNQIIVTALVVMIAVAGYLNFTEKKAIESSKNAMILTDEGDIETALTFNGPIDTLPDDEFAAANDEGEIVLQELDPITADITIAEADTYENEIVEASLDDTGSAVFVNASVNDADAYFAQAKLEREQSRAKQKEILNEMINNQNIETAQKEECADNMLEIQQRIEKETAAEAMIEAKGFTNAYVRIDDDTVDVVVSKSELTESELAQIEDIVKRKTGFEEDKIRISPLKK